jgi:hypothetical protein
MGFDALVRTRLTETVDDLPVSVPRGRCRVQTAQDGMSLSWHDEGGTSYSVMMAAERFERHLEAGAILIVDAAQIRGH